MNFDCTYSLKEAEEVLRFLKHILLQGLIFSFIFKVTYLEIYHQQEMCFWFFFLVAVMDLCPIKHSYISLVTDSWCVFEGSWPGLVVEIIATEQSEANRLNLQSWSYY